MGYAIRNDGLGWRAVDSAADIDVAAETYSDTAPVAPVPTDAQKLAMAQDQQYAAIDAAAGAVDTKYTTVVGQQGAIYQYKLAQALAYQSAGYPSLADPLTSADPNYALYCMVRGYREALRVTNAAATDTDSANAIIAQGQTQWLLGIGAVREELRTTGKARVAAATTVADAQAAGAAAVAALQAL